MPPARFRPLVGASLTVLSLLTATAPPAQAQAPVACEGHPFSPSASQPDGTAMRLNGVGMRAVAWLQGYVAGLYLEGRPADRPEASAAKVIEMPGAKRIEIRMLESAESREFSKAFQRGVKRHYKDTKYQAVAADVDSFSADVEGLPKLQKGDRIVLDFQPTSKQTVMSINGQPVAKVRPVAGKAFYDALLTVFIGEKPTDPELKAGLLGGKGC